MVRERKKSHIQTKNYPIITVKSTGAFSRGLRFQLENSDALLTTQNGRKLAVLEATK